jgi:hypothetical protein
MKYLSDPNITAVFKLMVIMFVGGFFLAFSEKKYIATLAVAACLWFFFGFKH